MKHKAATLKTFLKQTDKCLFQLWKKEDTRQLLRWLAILANFNSNKKGRKVKWHRHNET